MSNPNNSFVNPPKKLLQNKFDKFAEEIIKQLQKNGHDAYLVGGCIRDQLIDIPAKDFDVATSATPEQIRKIFKASRIIGKRFKLVHVYKGSQVIEVSTFRASGAKSNQEKIVKDQLGKILRDNVWGTIEEDCERRDFTINSLYFDPIQKKLFDRHQGVNDSYKRKIVSIGDPMLRFEEDPVRSLRAVRFATKLNFKIDKQIKDAIYEKGYLLSSISNARRFDEFNKIFMHGKAQHNFEKLETFDLLKHLVSHVGQSNSYGYRLQMSALINTDNRVYEGKSVTPGFLLAAILWPKLIEIATIEDSISTRRFFPNMDKILRDQQILTAVPRRFYTYIKDIWSLQLRLQSRIKNQPFKVLQHPRFRAAYDLLLLRIEASNSESEIGDWWTKFQSCNRQTKLEMIKRHRENSSNSKKFGLSGELG